MPPIPSPFAVFRTISRRTYPISRAAVRPYTQPFVRYQHSIPPIHTPNSSQQQSPEQPTPSQQKTEISALGRHSHVPRAKSQEEQQSTEAKKPDPPSYELTFTCTPCSTRSTHSISKHGYHFGSVLVTCPECRNRHVISDHLNIFGDRNLTIEDLMREQGQLIKKGTLSEDGDLEFWSDGSMNKRGQMHGKKYENREDDGAVRGESFNPGKAK